MVREDFICLTPLMIIAGAPVLMMLVVAVIRSYKVIYGLSLSGFILAFLSIFFLLPVIPHATGQLFIFDGFTILFFVIIILACLLITILSDGYLVYQESEKEEYFIILYTSALGALVLAAASNFVTLFLGLEMLSISLYVLIAYRRSRDNSIEAAVKYLILASGASGFLLFGMGLIYVDTGSLEFTKIVMALQSSGFSSPLLLTGFSMMVVGIGFKLALVPFHMWTPDVYHGAPVPVATFIATVSKGAVIAVLLRFFYAIEGFRNHNFILLITVVSILSMFIGNLLAIRQQNLKRILAYSSISNMGYLVITLLIGTKGGIDAAVFYIASYIITTIGAFGVITLLSDRDNEAEKLKSYTGLFWKRPWVAIVLTLTMLSLAGIPITSGFLAKFYVILEGLNAGLLVLVISLIINSVIGLYYYLRVVTILFSPPNDVKFPAISPAGRLVLFIVTLGILWLGIFPEWFFNLIARF
ncbi:MAG: NADH-quinone oxidoreductase subunit N [Bacteroidales bacterium]|nr:NADH-quinone oxidoreductase subunit N [Bacteroidales bacterium]